MRRFVLVFMLLILSCAALAGNVVMITSMRLLPAATKTIIYFDLSDRTTGTARYIPTEKKLVVKFDKSALKFRVNNAKLGGANITSFSVRQLPDASVEFYFQTIGNVKWKTAYEVRPDGVGVRVRLEIISKDPRTPAVKSKNERIESELLKELGQYKNKLQKLKMEQPAVIGRSRWEQYQIERIDTKAHIFTVVIDAGHGGKDSGAVGKKGAKEKEIVLSIARKIVSKLENIPGIRVVQTRKGDYYVPLRARLNIARRNDADLFIAVHADAYFNHRATGASVYALSQHGATSEASRWLARQENYSELDGIDFDQLTDRSRVLRSVLIDMAQTATIRDSLHLGNKVLDSLDRVSALHHRQVEQAGFVVLKSPDIPSILVETGFITNPQEEMQLNNPSYQDKIAAAVAHGVQAYIRKYAAR